MKQRQRGATFLGIVVILAILGSAGYAGLLLVPEYLDYMKVARSLEQVRDEYAATTTNPEMLRKSLERHWDVEDIKGIGWKEVEIRKSEGGYDMHAAYAVEKPFVSNVYLLVKFDKTATVPQ